MAIIPLGPLTIPSIRKLLINRPGLPGGRFCAEAPPPLVSLPRSGAKGSRRTMFSRSATGFTAGTAARVGTSDFAAVADAGDFRAELLAGPAEALLAGLRTGLAPPAVPGFEPGVVLEAGFAAEAFTGLALAFATAGPAGELDAEPALAFDAAGAGLTEVAAAGVSFGVCDLGAGFPAEAAWPAGEVFASAAGLAGAGWSTALWAASGAAGACCAARDMAAEASKSVTTRLITFTFRMTVYRSRIFNSILPFISPPLQPGARQAWSRSAAQQARS